MNRKFTKMLFCIVLSLVSTISYGAVLFSGADSCKADFSYAQDSANNAMFRFTDMSSPNITSRIWNFGDGTTSIAQNPSHIYSLQSGTSVNVWLRITTSSMCVDSIMRTITISDTATNHKCYANFTYRYIADTASAGATFEFIDMSSAEGNNIVSLVWNFGDGSISTEKYPRHTYFLQPGSIVNVRESIISSMGCSDTMVRTLTIPYVSPSDSCYANFSYAQDSLVSSGYAYRFSNLSSANATAWYWNFGDGTSSVLKDPGHIYRLQPGTTVNIVLRIATSVMCVDSIVKTITIPYSPQPDSCYADFTYAQDTTVSSAFTINFTDLSSANAISWYWNFGDGSSSALKNPSHKYYLQPGTQINVRLVISTSNGCSDTIVKTIFSPYPPVLKYFISGKVKGKNGLLSSGIIVLYQKNTLGRFILKDANVITDGLFKFEQLEAGKYIICAIPDINNSSKYLPTYYVNKLHWASADLIDLKSNAQGLTLQMISVRSMEAGAGSISGRVLNNSNVASSNETTLKSVTQISYNVYLYTESGEVISSVVPDENGNFTFDGLPYGTYSLTVEYPNLESSNMAVNLSPASPAASNVEFVIDQNALSVNAINKENDITVYNVSASQIAVRVSKGGKYNVSVISITGSVLFNSNSIDIEANTEKIISLGSVPSGTYLLKLQSNKDMLIKKLIK